MHGLRPDYAACAKKIMRELDYHEWREMHPEVGDLEFSSLSTSFRFTFKASIPQSAMWRVTFPEALVNSNFLDEGVLSLADFHLWDRIGSTVTLEALLHSMGAGPPRTDLLVWEFSRSDHGIVKAVVQLSLVSGWTFLLTNPTQMAVQVDHDDVIQAGCSTNRDAHYIRKMFETYEFKSY